MIGEERKIEVRIEKEVMGKREATAEVEAAVGMGMKMDPNMTSKSGDMLPLAGSTMRHRHALSEVSGVTASPTKPPTFTSKPITSPRFASTAR